MNPSKKTPNKIFFIGIGGSGMSGLAEVLFNLGYEVSGSDIKESDVTERLRVLGINLSIGHKVTNLDDVDMVIKSTAIEDTNVELNYARKLGLPVLFPLFYSIIPPPIFLGVGPKMKLGRSRSG